MFAPTSVVKGSTSSSKLPKYSSRGSLDRSKRPWFIALLVAVKVCSSLATFMLIQHLHTLSHDEDTLRELRSKDLNKGLSSSSSSSRGFLGALAPLVQTVAIIQFVSGLIYFVVQKPLSNKCGGISRWQWFRISRHALISTIFLLASTYALALCGPLRTIFISTQYDFTIAAILTGLFISKSGVRLRGGVLFVTGVVVLILFDDRSVHHEARGPTSPTFQPEEQPFFSDHSVGIMTLVICLLCKVPFQAFAKNLSVDVGGGKRLHALSTPTSALILMSLTFIHLITGGHLISMWWNFFSLLFIILFGFVLNHFVDTICMKRMETHQVARIGTCASHLSALLYSLVWVESNELPSVATLISFALCFLGMLSVTVSERASGGGSLVGYASDGLPLFSFSQSISSGNVPTWKYCIRLLHSFYMEIRGNRITRRVFLSFFLSASFSGVLFIYAAITNSGALFADAFHTLFSALSMFISLQASVFANWMKANRTFPFGYGRVEVLCAYLNALFMLVVAGVISIQAIIRLPDPPQMDIQPVIPISICSFIINLIRIYATRHSISPLINHTNPKHIFKYMLRETVSSLGVLVSSLLIKHFNLEIADSLCSLVIALVLVSSALPILKEKIGVLVLTVPSGLEKKLQEAVLQILAMEGVKGYRMARFWNHTQAFVTGSIHIQATRDANQQHIIRQVNNLFNSIGFSHFTTQVEKDEFIMRRNQENSQEDGDDLGSDEVAPRKGVSEVAIQGIGSNDFSSLNNNTLNGQSTNVQIDLV